MCGVGEVWGILILRWAWFYECFFKIHPLHADSMVLRFDYKAGTSTMTRSLRGGAIGVVRGRTTAKEWAVAVRLDPLESIDL